MIPRWTWFPAALTLGLLAGGCWDYRDINDRSLVLGMAVDAVPGQDLAHAVTAEVASPAVTSARAAAGPGAGAAQGGTPPGGRTLLRATAATSAHALAMQRASWARPLEFGHQLLLILGEEYARRGEKDELGCAGCHPAMSTSLHFLVARGRGGDFLSAVPPEGQFASLYLSTLVWNALARGSVPPTHRLSQFVAATEENGVALAPRLEWQGGQPRMAGAAVFQDYRLVGWLDEEETLGASLLSGAGRHTTLVVPCPPLAVGGSVTPARLDTTVRITYRSSKLLAETRDGRLVLRYRVSARARAWDAGCPRAPAPRGVSVEEERVLSQEAARAIRRLALLAIRRQRELGADFLGWGTYLRRGHPGLWRDLQGRWDKELRHIPVEVEVRVRVERQSRFH